MLDRLAHFSFRRRRIMLGMWLVAFLVLVVGLRSQAGPWKAEFSLPGTDTQKAFNLLKKADPSQQGEEGRVVFRADNGFSEGSRGRTKVNDVLANIIATNDQVEAVTIISPFSEQSGGAQVSPSGQTAFASFHFKRPESGKEKQLKSDAQKLRKSLVAAGNDSVQVQTAGRLFTEFAMPASEVLGVLAAIIILLVAFGSLVAMGLPILIALAGISIGLAIVGLLANFLSIPDFTAQVSAMIGLGVGIDYALFIVTRYRTALKSGKVPEYAMAEAMGTAGRAVVFAGCTVVVSLLGMFAMGVPFVRGLAIGASSTVFVAVLAAITLLPAMLGFIGNNIDRLGVHRKKSEGSEKTETFWHRWSMMLQRRAWFAVAAGGAVLVVLAIPVFSIRLGQADAGADPKASSTRKAYDFLTDEAKGFGPGFAGPFTIITNVPAGESEATVQDSLTKMYASVSGATVTTGTKTSGVAKVVPFGVRPYGNDGASLAIAQGFPTTSPQDEVTEQLIHHLRSDVIPTSVANTNFTTYLSGESVVNIDFASILGRRLPIFMASVLVVSFLLLMAVFRSILVPIKAVIMNLLSIGASYGILVAIFQWGWGAKLIGVETLAPIAAWAPMMLFAIVFGLSMDYEVFLLSRVREEYVRTGKNNVAVVEGLASTARVITAAAAIMVCVFAAFVLGENRDLKLMGLGLAVAVFLDATIVRMVLVPATMALLGDANWWFPKWLDRIVPHLKVEGSHKDSVMNSDKSINLADRNADPTLINH